MKLDEAIKVLKDMSERIWVVVDYGTTKALIRRSGIMQIRAYAREIAPSRWQPMVTIMGINIYMDIIMHEEYTTAKEAKEAAWKYVEQISQQLGIQQLGIEGGDLDDAKLDEGSDETTQEGVATEGSD